EAAPGRPWKRFAGPAAAFAALAALSWTLFAPGRDALELPFADHDALTLDAAGGVIAARGLRVERAGPDGTVTRLADLDRPARSLSWSEDGLYGADGTPALLRWRAAGERPDRFVLDHAPLAVFAANGTIWTQDAAGGIRQFLLNRSMTGVYLQPLDLAALPGGPVGPFAVDADGTLLAIDAAGALRRFAHSNGAYAAPRAGRSYGTGASLVPAPAGARVLVPRAEGAALIKPL
ncbi:MAG: hypothetical protein SF051_16420, partial [Elusimicrobiota bacterium]|nr:hypothetical protein [Elusimicrobiota bacterium]